MKTRFVLTGMCLVLSGVCLARAGTLFTNPIIFVQPSTIDFGTLERKQCATNSFVVENVGGGTLIGRAEVPPPFRIISGETYRLKRSEIQLVTIVYTPKSAATNIETVKFTGALADASATVRGKLPDTPSWYRPKRK